MTPAPYVQEAEAAPERIITGSSGPATLWGAGRKINRW